MDKDLIWFIENATKEHLLIALEAVKDQEQDGALIKILSDLTA